MREFTDGSTAIVRGALDAGCTFFAGYPITPASPILMQMMRELPKVGGVAIQGEDEIASIGMCIGAALAGARAMTATSGPGPLPLQREHRPGDHGRGAARHRRRAAARPGDRRRHDRRAGRRAVRALGHGGRLPDHRAGAVVGGRVLHADAPRLRPRRALPLPGLPAHRQGAEHDHHHGGRGRATTSPRCATRAALPVDRAAVSLPAGGGRAAARAVRRRRAPCASPARPTTSARSSPRRPRRWRG